MYIVKKTKEEFSSFLGSVKAANLIDSEVFESETMRRVWEPAKKVSPKRFSKYLERLAAYEAQQKMVSTK